MIQAPGARVDPRGSYLLVLAVPRYEGPIGALGRVSLPQGLYAYAGSAFGPGGVTARVARHCRPEKPLRWHIDYLTRAAPVILTLHRSSAERLECAWAQTLLALPGASAPALRFGATDCKSRCRSHLIRLPDGYDLSHLEALLCKTLT